MPIIIDGWNLARNDRSGIEDEDALEAASALLSFLECFQETHSDPMIVVFDSSSAHLDLPRGESRGIKVVAVRDADDYIKRYIDKVPERQRRNVRVVSSDTGVYYYAKSSYAVPVRSEDFWSKIRSVRRP